MFLNKNNLALSLGLVLILVLSGCTTTQKNSSDKLSLSQARYGHAAVNDGENLYVIAGSHGNKFLTDIEIINPTSGTKEIIKDIFIPRRYASAVWDGKHSIYIIGGTSLEDNVFRYERKIEVFDTISHKVSFVESLPVPGRISSAVYLDGKIYVMGGIYSKRGKEKGQRHVSILDIEKNRWKRGKSMPTAKAAKTIEKDGYIYAVGGFDGNSSLDVFERYDPANNHWQSLPKLPAKISAHSLALVNNKLFVFGNYHDLDATYTYDFNTREWQKVDIGYKASRHNASTTIDDTIYVIGGNTGGKGPFHDYIQVFKNK